MHVAIVMDGNGRWAQAQGQTRAFGHREGANAARRAVEAARSHGVNVLTLFAFSGDNWKRPPDEVRALMSLFRSFLMQEMVCCAQNGIRLTIIGRRDRLDAPLLRTIEDAEAFTAAGDAMLLRIAVDYSSRDAILSAAVAWHDFGRPGVNRTDTNPRDTFALLMQATIHSAVPAPDVDLLIRTGGELRLSDFMLWECAYAELVFTTAMWPEFSAAHLDAALREFESRQRRFGAIPEPSEARAG